MQLTLFQTLVIKPLVRSILGALGLLSSEEQIDAFVGSLFRYFVLPGAPGAAPAPMESLVSPETEQLATLWTILLQTDVDIGLSDLRIQAASESVLGAPLPDFMIPDVITAVHDGDFNQFLIAISNNDPRVDGTQAASSRGL